MSNPTLWIFDYDQTLLPNGLAQFLVSYVRQNYFDDGLVYKISVSIIVFLNILTIINRIHAAGDTIVILTASINGWVDDSMNVLFRIINMHSDMIDEDFIKYRLLDESSYTIIQNLGRHRNLVNEGFFNKITEIVYVHVYERLGRSLNRVDKYNSLKMLIDKYSDFNNIIVLGDSHENERKHTIALANNIEYKNTKTIKFVQFLPATDISVEQKIKEQLLFYNNISNIHGYPNSVIFDVVNNNNIH
jgi:hypothetical protein